MCSKAAPFYQFRDSLITLCPPISVIVKNIIVVSAGSTLFVWFRHPKSSGPCLPCFSENRISIFVNTPQVGR